jgi:hypothetical protein
VEVASFFDAQLAFALAHPFEKSEINHLFLSSGEFLDRAFKKLNLFGIQAHSKVALTTMSSSLAVIGESDDLLPVDNISRNL